MVFGNRTAALSLRIILFRILLAFLMIPLIVFSSKELAGFFFATTALLSFGESVIRKKISSVPQSRLILDSVADKVLINGVALTLWAIGTLPLWVPAVFLVRDVLTIIGASVAYRFKYTEFKPTSTGKMALFFQTVALLAAVWGIVDLALLIIAACATIISALEAFVMSEFRKARRRKKKRDEFSLIRMIKIPDILSLGNVVAGLVCIMLSVTGEFFWAAASLLIAVVFDYFDGKVARWLKQEHDFGKELDSLADTISFGVAPAIFAFSLIQTKLAIIAFTIFVFCGILRLARYNIMNVKGEYAGMPITMNGVIIPLVFYAGMPAQYYPYLYLLLGFLMVSSIKVKKLG